MTEAHPGEGWRQNDGSKPSDSAGKRARVILRNGKECGDPVNPTAPPGWSVESARWSLRDDPWDIIWFKVL